VCHHPVNPTLGRFATGPGSPTYCREDRVRHFHNPPHRRTCNSSNSPRTRQHDLHKLFTIPPRVTTLHSCLMAQEMRGHSFRSFAAAHFAPIKDYLVHRDPLSTHHHHHHHHVSTEVGYAEGDARKHSRIHFSGHRTKRSYSDSDAATSNERVVLLPGWVSRRYRAGPELSNRAGASPRLLFIGEPTHDL
jgi:hypothetical protein